MYIHVNAGRRGQEQIHQNQHTLKNQVWSKNILFKLKLMNNLDRCQKHIKRECASYQVFLGEQFRIFEIYLLPYFLWPTRFCGSYGGPQRPQLDINEGVISDPILLCSLCYLVKLGVTSKNSDRSLKIWAWFQDFKFLPKIQDTNFTCKLNF